MVLHPQKNVYGGLCMPDHVLSLEYFGWVGQVVRDHLSCLCAVTVILTLFHN